MRLIGFVLFGLYPCVGNGNRKLCLEREKEMGIERESERERQMFLNDEHVYICLLGIILSSLPSPPPISHRGQQ